MMRGKSPRSDVEMSKTGQLTPASPIIYQFIYSDLIGLYLKEERLHNPCCFVFDIYLFSKLKYRRYLVVFNNLKFTNHSQTQITFILAM